MLGSLTCRKAATWNRRLYFPSEGRHAEDFFAPKKIRRLQPGFNPRTWVPEASMLTTRPPKPLRKDLVTAATTIGDQALGPQLGILGVELNTPLQFAVLFNEL
jgi:hypothetical protein